MRTEIETDFRREASAALWILWNDRGVQQQTPTLKAYAIKGSAIV
jgi:hypothetical protein